MEELEEKESKETEEIKESNDVKETKEANKQEKKDPVDTKKIAKRKEKLKNFLNNPLNLTAVALLVIVIVTKLYYFSLTSNQPTWWDEGDYLAIAKELAIPSVESPEWWGHFTRMRPPIMPLVWSFFIKFGLSEAIMRFFTLLIPSILLIVLTYLLAESLFNKRVALISGFLIATYWVVEFYTHRLLTDIPALFLVMLSAYLFWEYYEKRKKPYGLYLSIFFGVLAFLTRFPSALVTMSALAYLIFIKKHKFFTDKHIWIAGFIGVATLIPYFLWNKISLGSFFPAAAFYGSENTSTYFNPAWNLFQFIPQFIGWPITALFLLGLIYALFNVLIGFDVVFKQKSKKCNKHLFLVSWLILQVIYFVFVIKTGNDRWMLTWMPPIFIYAGFGMDLIYKRSKKYSKYLGLIFIIIILGIYANSSITHADSLVKSRLTSYNEVKQTGEWLRLNTPEDAKIMAASIVQNTYYSHRRTYDFYIGTELQEETQRIDPQGRLIDKTYITLRNETELECKIVRIKPDYLVIHGLEPEFTPQFMYDYPQRNPDLFTPVQGFYRGDQISAVIFKFEKYPEIDPREVNCDEVYNRAHYLSGLPLEEVDPFRVQIPS